VKTTTGQIELSIPKLRDTDERFCSALFNLGLRRAAALAALVVSAWERGLSDRDMESRIGVGEPSFRQRLGVSRAPRSLPSSSE
jgi:hypothetical protein